MHSTWMCMTITVTVTVTVIDFPRTLPCRKPRDRKKLKFGTRMRTGKLDGCDRPIQVQKIKKMTTINFEESVGMSHARHDKEMLTSILISRFRLE
jgi:hypothetical protein